jgi:hypothetical protein
VLDPHRYDPQGAVRVGHSGWGGSVFFVISKKNAKKSSMQRRHKSVAMQRRHVASSCTHSLWSFISIFFYFSWWTIKLTLYFIKIYENYYFSMLYSFNGMDRAIFNTIQMHFKSLQHHVCKFFKKIIIRWTMRYLKWIDNF